MVRRLIHQEDVGSHQEDLRHGHAGLPSAAQGAHVAVDLVTLETETMEDLIGAGFEFVATTVLVLALDLPVAIEQRLQFFPSAVVAQGNLQILELVMKVAEATAPRDRFVQHASTRHAGRVLPEESDRRPLRDRDVPFVRLLFPDDQTEQCRLAGAVRPHQSDLLSRC